VAKVRKLMRKRSPRQKAILVAAKRHRAETLAARLAKE
jgi:hypothetical protein